MDAGIGESRAKTMHFIFKKEQKDAISGLVAYVCLINIDTMMIIYGTYFDYTSIKESTSSQNNLADLAPIYTIMVCLDWPCSLVISQLHGFLIYQLFIALKMTRGGGEDVM